LCYLRWVGETPIGIVASTIPASLLYRKLLCRIYLKEESGEHVVNARQSKDLPRLFQQMSLEGAEEQE
jgi:hypothetical protein